MRRWSLIMAAAGGLVVIAAGATISDVLDPNLYKERITAAVERQTGRKLMLAGKLRLTLLPVPALEAADVSFANQPGGSRPQMLTAARIRAEIAWLPLLRQRIVITRLTLMTPDLLLERDQAGRGNWSMQGSLPVPDATAPAAPGAAHRPPIIEVQAVRLVGGAVTWRGARTLAFALTRLDLTAEARDAPITLSASASLTGTDFEFSGHFGSLARLRDEHATDPWPARLSINAADAAIGIEGSFTAPNRLAGYDVSVTAAAADLSRLRPLLPGVTLPALRDLHFAAHVTAGDPLPKVSELILRAGPSDLDGTVPGLRLAAIDVSAPAPDLPIHVAMSGTYAGSPLMLTARAGPPASWLPGGGETPFPLDVTAEAAGARLDLKGVLARPRDVSGLQVTVSASVPDLTALVPLAQRRLPALHDIALAAELSDQDGLAHGVTVRGLRLRGPQGDLSGDLAVRFDQPSVEARLSGSQLDIDALRAAWQVPEGGPSGGPRPAAPGPGRSFIIPDTKFDFSVLHRGNADLRFDVGTLVAGGVVYRSVTGHMVLHDGRMVIDPAAAVLAGGPMSGHLEIDAGHSPASLSIALQAAALPLQPLLTAVSVPDDVAGALQIDTDLHGAGDSPHAVAASLDGMIGLSMVGGTLDNRLLIATFGELLRAGGMPPATERGGRTDIRCFALRLDADHGVAAVRAFMLDTSRLRLTGAGTVDFGRERLALRLRPFVRVAGSGVVVPLHVGGSFQKPVPTVDPSGVPEAAAAVAAGLADKGSAISEVTSAFAAAGERLLGEADTGNCDPALALARDGKPGPEPAAPKSEKTGNAVNDLLKRLFK